MANVELNDFGLSFEDHYASDLDYIAGKANDLMEDMDRRYGGALAELNRNFGQYRDQFMQLLEVVIDKEVYDNQRVLEDIITNAVYAAIAATAAEIDRHYGSRESDDWIRAEARDNPILRDASRSTRDDRRRDDRRDSSRYTNRRSDYVRPASRREDRSRDRNERSRDSDRGRDRRSSRSDRRRERVERDAPVGRIAAATQPARSEREESRRPEREREERKAPEPATTVNSGDVVTSANLGNVDTKAGLVYVVGKEQVILNGDELEITAYTGETAVDYAAHCIDRFYPDILGDSQHTELTASAIREAEKVKEQTIEAYIKNPAEPEAEPVQDPKLFMHAHSGTYGEVLQVETKAFSPIEVRDDIISLHTGTIDWFNKNALYVKIEQFIDISTFSNDAVKHFESLITTDKVVDLLNALLALAPLIDTAVWKLLHDYLTVGFNKRLTSVGLGIDITSITADWNAFKKYVADNRPELAETLNMKNGITGGMRVDNTDEYKRLVFERNTIYIPVNSFDLDIASATAAQGFGILTEGTMLFNFIHGLHSTGTPVLYITTLDGETLASRDCSGVMGSRYYITKA